MNVKVSETMVQSILNNPASAAILVLGVLLLARMYIDYKKEILDEHKKLLEEIVKTNNENKILVTTLKDKETEILGTLIILKDILKEFTK